MTSPGRRGPLPESVATRYPHGYAVVDVETTGLNPRADRVLQVAISRVRADGLLEDSWATLLDPGCDPGPVEIHGLTRERLQGSPRYDDVGAHIAALLVGRVFVGHNASFDWRFLSAEGARSSANTPATARLCTMGLTRRLDLPTASLKLSAVADYWGVAQGRAHDAEDDVRVVVEVLRHSLVVADRLALPLPITLPQNARPVTPYPARPPRTPCAYRYPGRATLDGPLTQGMTVVFTGPTQTAREVLMRSAQEAGLDVMSSVSSRTSLVVCNDARTSTTTKMSASRAHGTTVVDERRFVTMLSSLRPGTLKSDPASGSPASASQGASRSPGVSAPTGRLAGQRILVMGGEHARSAEVRARVGELGGQAAVNLTPTVCGVVALQQADSDSRWARVMALGLPLLDPETFEPYDAPQASTHVVPTQAAPAAGPAGVGSSAADAIVLTRGAVTDLVGGSRWSVDVTWDHSSLAKRDVDVDVVAFVVDADGQVSADDDFCFYNQPRHPTRSIALHLDVPSEAVVEVDLSLLPQRAERIVVAASIEGDATFGDLGPIELVIRDGDGAPIARATLDAASSERSLLLASIYLRKDTWRVRAIGQGYDAGLSHLAVLHGVDIED